jgi:hypothetical protein
MDSEREISVDMAEDEWSAMMSAPDAEAHTMSATARAALWSAAPHPGGIERWFICSVAVAARATGVVRSGTVGRRRS